MLAADFAVTAARTAAEADSGSWVFTALPVPPLAAAPTMLMWLRVSVSSQLNWVADPDAQPRVMQRAMTERITVVHTVRTDPRP